MPKITIHYGINSPVPFVDVEVETDTRLYVDPHAIRLWKTPQPFANQALTCIDTFMNEVTDSILKETEGSRLRGNDLLQRFVEPKETRLGMSATGFYGHGGAEGIGTWIWDALNNDAEALARVGVLKHLEDLPLFVEGIDRDITSDITTRIIFGPLAEFTKRMIDTYPQLTSGEHRVRNYHKQVWNPTIRDWDEAEVTLPVVNGEPLLLVPREWARPTLLMSATRYYETSVLTFAQLEQAVRGSNGKLIKTPKDQLKKQPGLGRGRGTNMRITMRAIEKNENLVAVFKIFVAERLDRGSFNE